MLPYFEFLVPTQSSFLRFFFLMFFLTSFSVALENTTGPAQKQSAEHVRQVVIRGNTILKRSEYLSALGVKTKAWYAFWKDENQSISDHDAVHAEDRLRDFLDSKGFYDAKIRLRKTPSKLIVTVHEGKPVRVSRISIEGDFNLSHLVTFKKGSRFEAEQFIAIKRAIKEALMKAGYCNDHLETKAYVDLATQGVAVKYRVEKGALCHFGKTRIVGKPANIDEAVILSRLRYREGDIFNTEKITETFDALNSLDAFGSGTVAPQEREDDASPSSTVAMDVDLAPKKKRNLFKGGIGYDTLMGARFQLYYERRNFMGNARKLTGTLQYARKSQLAEVTYFSPAVLKLGSDYLDFYDKLGYSHNRYAAYTADKAYFDLALKYERDALKATAGLGFEHIRIAQTGHEALPGLIPGNFLMLYPYFHLVWDQRDSKINPKNGYYLSAYSEYGLGFRKENSRYLKLLFEGRYIKSFGDLTLATVAKAGFIDTAYGQLPASKLFYAGGAYSNRAYGERQIGTVLSPVASSALGGKTWLNLSLEANYPIDDKLDGAIFFDRTMISDKEYDFKGKRIDSVGVGLRYLTPIGPVKADVGVNIHDWHQYGFSFQIGQSF